MIETFQDRHRCKVCGWEQPGQGWVPVSQPVPHTADHQGELAAPVTVMLTPVLEPIGLNTITQGNCLDLLPRVASGSVDMVLCDLPYGTTQNAWDTVIPFDRLWEQYRRILKPGGTVVLSASQPFTTAVVASNYPWFRYEWIWRKNNATGHLNAHRMPMKEHENILVFGQGTVPYNAQGLRLFMKKTRRGGNGGNFGKSGTENFQQFTGYPRSVLEFETDSPKLHPTQKPVALWEYLIRTYTNEGDTVLDNCCGSGTTGVACQNTGRNFIQFELSPEYCEIARSRLKPLAEERIAA